MELKDRMYHIENFILTNEFRISDAWADLSQRGADTAQF